HHRVGLRSRRRNLGYRCLGDAGSYHRCDILPRDPQPDCPSPQAIRLLVGAFSPACKKLRTQSFGFSAFLFLSPALARDLGVYLVLSDAVLGTYISTTGCWRLFLLP